jgi:putative ABC transport system ATP-binding protein
MGVDAVIRLTEVTKRYVAGGAPALDQVSLEVARGEAVAVMGPSGSGKSTLLNLVAGLDKPTGGTVVVAGQRVDMLSETRAARFRRREVGMIFQFFNLLEDLTVADNVLQPAGCGSSARCSSRTQVPSCS